MKTEEDERRAQKIREAIGKDECDKIYRRALKLEKTHPGQYPAAKDLITNWPESAQQSEK